MHSSNLLSTRLSQFVFILISLVTLLRTNETFAIDFVYNHSVIEGNPEELRVEGRTSLTAVIQYDVASDQSGPHLPSDFSDSNVANLPDRSTDKEEKWTDENSDLVLNLTSDGVDIYILSFYPAANLIQWFRDTLEKKTDIPQWGKKGVSINLDLSERSFPIETDGNISLLRGRPPAPYRISVVFSGSNLAAGQAFLNFAARQLLIPASVAASFSNRLDAGYRLYNDSVNHAFFRNKKSPDSGADSGITVFPHYLQLDALTERARVEQALNALAQRERRERNSARAERDLLSPPSPYNIAPPSRGLTIVHVGSGSSGLSEYVESSDSGFESDVDQDSERSVSEVSADEYAEKVVIARKNLSDLLGYDPPDLFASTSMSASTNRFGHNLNQELIPPRISGLGQHWYPVFFKNLSPKSYPHPTFTRPEGRVFHLPIHELKRNIVHWLATKRHPAYQGWLKDNQTLFDPEEVAISIDELQEEVGSNIVGYFHGLETLEFTLDGETIPIIATCSMVIKRKTTNYNVKIKPVINRGDTRIFTRRFEITVEGRIRRKSF